MNLRAVGTVLGGLLGLSCLGYAGVLVLEAGEPVEAQVVTSYVAAPLSAAVPAQPMQSVEPVQPTLPGGVSEAWVRSTAAKAQISTVAMRAYANAQLAAPDSCELGWTTLAGIGWVESHHGTIEGRTLSEDGLPSAPITGIPLGDLDRAYGPMQFIPSTWKAWGIDGNGDGVADPQNIYDAALAAANYLCHDGPLTSGAAWSKAVFSYNHSDVYVQQVHAAAQEYAARVG